MRLPPIRFVREAAVGYQISARVNADAIRQLARAGVNLNQMARKANTAGQVAEAAALRHTLQAVRNALDRLL